MKMKIRSIKLMVKEGVSNSYKNKLMTIASTTIVIATLLIFGLFLLITITLINNAQNIQSMPEVTVYLESEIDELSEAQIEHVIQNDPLVLEYDKVTKEEAFNELKQMLEDDSLIEGYSSDFMMSTFNVKLYDPSKSLEFSTKLTEFEGIDSIKYPQEVIDFITKVVRWINLTSMLVMIVLILVAVAIISNTIKIAVFARRKEISIMRYIGATDWFIKWPFVIEGIIIGLVGSLLSYVLTSYLYNVLYDTMNNEIINVGIKAITFVPFRNISMHILSIYVIIGVVMGVIGSILSVRRYLDV